MENFLMNQSIGLETAMLESVSPPLLLSVQAPVQVVIDSAKNKLPKYNHIYMYIIITALGGCAVYLYYKHYQNRNKQGT